MVPFPPDPIHFLKASSIRGAQVCPSSKLASRNRARAGPLPQDPVPTVVYLGRNLYVGGAERVMVHYLNEARRVHPIGVLLEARGPLLGEIRPHVPVYDLSRHPSPVPHAPRHSDGTPHTDSVAKWKIVREAWRLRGIIRATGATLVSSFLMRSHIVALLTRALWCHDVRVVFNVHSMILQSEPYLYPDMLSRGIMRAFLRGGFPRADRIITVAQAVAEEVRSNVRLPEARLTVAHNPIDGQAIRRAAVDGPTVAGLDGPVLVAVGRMVPLKGFDLLLDAVARIGPSERPAVILVGDGPERVALEERAERLGIASRVHMVGQRSNPWGYIAQATALVVSSRTEALPNVIGEALVLGVPVVSTNCSRGIEEYLQHGSCGILVPPDDVEAMVSALKALLADGSLRDRLREAGRTRVDGFGLTAMVDAYERALLETLRG